MTNSPRKKHAHGNAGPGSSWERTSNILWQSVWPLYCLKCADRQTTDKRRWNCKRLLSVHAPVTRRTTRLTSVIFTLSFQRWRWTMALGYNAPWSLLRLKFACSGVARTWKQGAQGSPFNHYPACPSPSLHFLPPHTLTLSSTFPSHVPSFWLQFRTENRFC